MAFIETIQNNIIVDQANAFNGYVSMTNGYADGYGQMFSLTFSGTTLTVGTGMLIKDGVRVISDTLTNINVGTSPSPTTYKVYLLVNMNLKTATFTFVLATTTKQNDDLFKLFTTGIAYIEIGTFVKTTTGVTSATRTIRQSINTGTKVTTVYSSSTGSTLISFPDIDNYQSLVVKAGVSGAVTTVVIQLNNVSTSTKFNIINDPSLNFATQGYVVVDYSLKGVGIGVDWVRGWSSSQVVIFEITAHRK